MGIASRLEVTPRIENLRISFSRRRGIDCRRPKPAHDHFEEGLNADLKVRTRQAQRRRQRWLSLACLNKNLMARAPDAAHAGWLANLRCPSRTLLRERNASGPQDLLARRILHQQDDF
jgi:hypothetical protein